MDIIMVSDGYYFSWMDNMCRSYNGFYTKIDIILRCEMVMTNITMENGLVEI